MLKLENINLAADLLAARYVKAETVEVTFAREAGELISLEGPNRYQTGDALITGSTGSLWPHSMPGKMDDTDRDHYRCWRARSTNRSRRRVRRVAMCSLETPVIGCWNTRPVIMVSPLLRASRRSTARSYSGGVAL